MPAAKFIVVEDEDEPDNRRQAPNNYVRYSGKESVSNAVATEYDIDEEVRLASFLATSNLDERSQLMTYNVS